MKKHMLAFWLIGSMVSAGELWAQNPYYDHGTFPAPGSAGSSAAMRAELDLIEAGFAKLPTLSGNANKSVVVNGSGTALTTTTGTLTLPGNFALSGANALTLTTTGATNVTLPTTGTLSTLAGSELLSNKTIAAPVFSGTATGTYTLGGTPTITAPVLSGTTTGTYTLGGTPTITAPVLSGTTTGTYTLGGTPTVSSAVNLTSGQITFPASQNASAGANTLDDYEEGTWTPSIGGTATYSTQAGNYTKIGRLVCVNGHFTINTIGTGSTSEISGLPFAAVGNAAFTVTRTANLALSVVSLAGYTFSTSSIITLYSRTAAATSEGANAVLGSGASLTLQGCYQAAT